MAVTREQIWKNLANTKFKALFTCECSRLASRWSNIYSVVVAIGTASSIGTWVVWKEIPYVWAAIVAIAQVLQIIKPSIPFIGHDKSFLDASFKFEALYLEYERLWQKIEDTNSITKGIEKNFNELRSQDLKIEETHKDITRYELTTKIREKINLETNKVLDLQFK